MSSTFAQHTLSNGLRVYVEPMPDVKSVACGFLVRTGSRDETAELAGVSHFLEHMCFKGTPRRKWQEITADFDRLGSIYNAFTWKDKTAYYGWVPADNFEPQLELLSDMMRSTLPSEEFDTEKKVVLEEIAQSGDDLSHTLVDLLFEKAFRDSPLGWPVLGYEKTVEAMTRDQMAGYLSRRYSANNLRLVVTGRVKPDEVFRLAESLCGDIPSGEENSARLSPTFHAGTAVQQIDRFKQQAVALVFRGPPAGHRFEEEGRAMASIIGGDNSRIYWSVIQEGLSACAGATYLDFHDCAIFALSAVCQPENCEACVEALEAEALKITREGAREPEVQRVRNKRRTGLAVEGEAPYHRFVQLVDDIDYHGAPRTVEERLAAVDAITPQTLGEYLEAFPITDKGMFVSVGPRNWPIL